jgi:hypothetical protein
VKIINSMLGGPLVTTAWLILPPDMEGICRYYIEERVKDSRKRGGPHTWGLNVHLTSHHRKACYEMSQRALELEIL